jgi:uncharacterized protein YuzE
MRMRVDHAADAIYLNLTDRPIKESEEVADGIVVDYDDKGRIVGIEYWTLQSVPLTRPRSSSSASRRRKYQARRVPHLFSPYAYLLLIPAAPPSPRRA